MDYPEPDPSSGLTPSTREAPPSGGVFKVRDGDVFYRGCFHRPEDCERLLSLLRAVAADPTDYFHREAKVRADELESCMREAGLIDQRDAA
jgi:hypothetical protein